MLVSPTVLDSTKNFNFCSSLADDASHKSENSESYEWWYFDAVSDDGRDVLVVIFLDNFVFSPRYNSHNSKLQSPKSRLETLEGESGIWNLESGIKRFPAIAFTYYRDNKVLYRAINEVCKEDFEAGADFPYCRVDTSNFQFEATPYGVRYSLNINATLSRRRTVIGAFEWLAVERDLAPPTQTSNENNKHFWNLALPRADVTGKMEVLDKTGNQLDQIKFRGTGYHDHNADSRWMPVTVAQWQWGRAHFSDATAVFYRYRETGMSEPVTKLFLVRENKLSAADANCTVNNLSRNLFGLKYPKKLDFLTSSDYLLTVTQSKLIDASFFYLRFLSEITLDLGDGRKREIIGVTEHLAPRSLKFRWLDWLINMRIGRNGKGAFLP